MLGVSAESKNGTHTKTVPTFTGENGINKSIIHEKTLYLERVLLIEMSFQRHKDRYFYKNSKDFSAKRTFLPTKIAPKRTQSP